MIYTTYQDLADCIRRNAWKVPADIDLIVGIPRSGMIPALMLAELLNKRCADLDSFADGHLMSYGARGNLMQCAMTHSKQKVLVIDDTIWAGNAITQAREKLAPLQGHFKFIYCCVYAESESAKQMVDVYFEDSCRPNEKVLLKEWNVLHLPQRRTKASMWDIDGLLCKDPPDDRDQAAYEQYLPDAIPMVIPTTKIGALVTYRLERYRAVTEEWLHRHGIEYGQLLMFPSNDREERNHTQSPAKYKARLYAAATWAKVFYESEARQAERIHRLTSKPVFCYENGQMYI